MCIKSIDVEMIFYLVFVGKIISIPRTKLDVTALKTTSVTLTFDLGQKVNGGKPSLMSGHYVPNMRSYVSTTGNCQWCFEVENKLKCYLCDLDL